VERAAVGHRRESLRPQNIERTQVDIVGVALFSGDLVVLPT